MRRTSDRRPTTGRARVGLTALVLSVVAVVGVRDASPGSGDGAGGPGAWRSGKPLAIKVAGGLARFVVPTPSEGARTLVIVSALSRDPGPFPVRLAARAVGREEATAPETEPQGARRAPGASAGPLPPPGPPASGLPPRRRTFHLLARDGDVASASNYLAVVGRLRAVGHRVQVYVDADDDARVGPAVLRDVVATFDDRVFPVAAGCLGLAKDVDGDGRFTVLMSGWLTRLAGGRHVVDGFVRGADFDVSLAAPFSNHCDMMYLSTAMAPGPHLRTVLAHEYTHAVTFSTKPPPAHAPGGVAPEEEGWLDEALAHLVEDLHGFSRSNLDYRVSAFLSRPERYRLVVADYYAADLFRSHGNRGATYLFLRWCADRFGPGLVPALIRSERLGVANLEAATGWRFADLYRAWTVALFLDGLDPSGPRGPGPSTVDVRGAFDGWDLAGPRTVTVAPDGPDATWESAGTATRYVVVGPAPGGATEVTVTAPPGAALQVTAVPLPDDLAELDLLVRGVPDPDGAPCLRADVRERNGTPVRLSSLSWEPLVPGADPHAPGFRRDGLDGLGVAASFGTSRVPARGRLSSGLIPAPGALDGPHASLVVKAVGTDARGRRVAAWAELPVAGRGAAGEE